MGVEVEKLQTNLCDGPKVLADHQEEPQFAQPEPLVKENKPQEYTRPEMRAVISSVTSETVRREQDPTSNNQTHPGRGFKTSERHGMPELDRPFRQKPRRKRATNPRP